MVEYGQGVSQGTQQGGGGQGTQLGGGDLGGQAMDAVADFASRIAALPIEVLVVGAIAIVAGLVILRRAF